MNSQQLAGLTMIVLHAHGKLCHACSAGLLGWVQNATSVLEKVASHLMVQPPMPAASDQPVDAAAVRGAHLPAGATGTRALVEVRTDGDATAAGAVQGTHPLATQPLASNQMPACAFCSADTQDCCSKCSEPLCRTCSRDDGGVCDECLNQAVQMDTAPVALPLEPMQGLSSLGDVPMLDTLLSEPNGGPAANNDRGEHAAGGVGL